MRNDKIATLSWLRKPFFLLLVVGVVGIGCWAEGMPPLQAGGELLLFTLGSPVAIARTLSHWAVVLLLGLSVLFAGRAGLWNTGIVAQCCVGLWSAGWVGMHVQAPIGVLAVLCLVAAVFAAGALGLLMGCFRQWLAVPEWITGLLLSGAAYQGFDFWMESALGTQPVALQPNALLGMPAGINEWMQGIPILSEMAQEPLHWGIPLCVLLVPVVCLLLRRSSFAYEMRTSALHPAAARRAGMPFNASVLLTLGWAGALAGLAAAVYLLGPSEVSTPLEVLREDMALAWLGFPVAILGGFGAAGLSVAAVLVTVAVLGGEAIGLPVGWLIMACALLMMPAAWNENHSIIRKRPARKREREVAA